MDQDQYYGGPPPPALQHGGEEGMEYARGYYPTAERMLPPATKCVSHPIIPWSMRLGRGDSFNNN